MRPRIRRALPPGGLLLTLTLTLALALFAPAALLSAGSLATGGDVRFYPFLILEDVDPNVNAGRRDAESAEGRWKLQFDAGEQWRVESHLVLSLASPASGPARGLVLGDAPHLFPLERSFVDRENLEARIAFDRLNVSWSRSSFRAVVGRQAITWGVSMLWPVIDLFAPFPPERIDREYKPGVDAARVSVPLGDFSEIEVVAAASGPDGEALSAGSLARFHCGRLDLGVMGGRFHGDLVAGGFVTGDWSGTGLRAEISYTDSGDESAPPAGAPGATPSRFARATFGVTRQVTPGVLVVGELSWNGFGASDSAGYAAVARSDRFRTGEVASLGRWYAGGILDWRPHPLLTVKSTGLVNLQDRSLLLLPSAEWSLSDDATLVFGASLSLGSEAALTPVPTAGTEFGAIPVMAFVGIRYYF